MQEALTMLREGNLGLTVAPQLAAKYNCGDGEGRAWVAEARKLLAAETVEVAKEWAGELVAAAADLYRDAKASGDRPATGQALDRLWKFTGNDVTRTVNENTHRALPTLPPTPAELAAIIAEQRGCTLEQALEILSAEADAAESAAGSDE